MPRRQARRARGTGGARAVWPASAVCALFAAGCYEIPPVIPEGYVGSPAATGWPPPAAYAPDALDPRNRWLQRAFAPRDERGALLPLHADEPFSLHERPRRVDLAELAALLERVLDGGTEWPDRIASAAFRSDALAEASRLAALGFQDGPPKDVVALLLRAARGEAPSAEDLEDPILAPPPLRGGPWREADPPAGGHDPSPRDPRWTRVLRGGEDGARSVLLRLRVALDLEGKPQLLELASECWELERGPTALRASVWRFDRAERVHGRDPWRELPGSAEVALRDPSDPSRLLAAPVERLCASCHERSVSAAPAPAPAAGAASVAPPSTAERVARALEGVLGGR